MKISLDHDEIIDIIEAHFKSKGFDIKEGTVYHFSHEPCDKKDCNDVNDLSLDFYL